MDDGDLDLLLELLTVDSPSGDEGRMADWLTGWIGNNVPDADVVRLRDSLIVSKGDRPKVAVYAHIDTNGFTVGYEDQIVPIGSPIVDSKQPVRIIGQASGGSGVLLETKGQGLKVKRLACSPGDRLVYATPPNLADGSLISPYIDNRGGIWAALKALRSCHELAVAFTSGEEMNGNGCLMCTRHIYETWGVQSALISDITWHTDYVKCGKGVAISLRDAFVPPQRFVGRVLALAEGSGIPFQREIERSGGSDGSSIERSGYPVDWVFVGAPEKRAHAVDEEVSVTDLDAMSLMMTYLVDRLSR